MTLSTVSSIEVIYEAFGLKFPEHVRTISQLTIQLITDDKLIIENEVWMKLQGLIFGYEDKIMILSMFLVIFNRRKLQYLHEFSSMYNIVYTI
jgi:hypothetical protein